MNKIDILNEKSKGGNDMLSNKIDEKFLFLSQINSE